MKIRIQLVSSVSITFLMLVAIFGILPTAYSQKYPQKNPNQKIERINPVKPDTNDPNRKALNKFSKDNMFNVAAPKVMKPEEVKAANFFSEGSKLGKAGDYPGAIVEFTRSIDLVRNPNTYALRGYAYLMVGNYGAAIQDATETIRLQESHLKAYFIRGIARFETGDYKGSKDDLSIYLDRDRTVAIAFNYMAALDFMSNDFKGALENYNEVVKIDPQYPDIYTNRGMMRHHNQDYQGAIQDYDEALTFNPENVTAYNNRGAAYIMLNDMPSALKDFDKAITINPKYGDAYDNRGRVKQAMGDITGACEDWNAAIYNGRATSRDLILKYCK